jgi:hypothetical protein
MRGFVWSERLPLPQVSQPPGGDLWCIRDAFCALMGWPPGSEGWEAFIEAPRGRDMYRLVEHLGLEWFDPEYYPHQAEIAARLDRPGVLLYDLFVPTPTGFQPMGHTMYEPHLRNPLWLSHRYAPYRPGLVNVVVDTRQPPSARDSSLSW